MKLVLACCALLLTALGVVGVGRADAAPTVTEAEATFAGAWTIRSWTVTDSDGTIGSDWYSEDEWEGTLTFDARRHRLTCAIHGCERENERPIRWATSCHLKAQGSWSMPEFVDGYSRFLFNGDGATLSDNQDGTFYVLLEGPVSVSLVIARD